MATNPPFDPYPKRTLNLAIAAAVAALRTAMRPTYGTATPAQATFTLSKAMAHGTEDQVVLFVGGAIQDASQYTFNGTTTATLNGWSMAAGDRWRAINFG